MRLSGVKTNNSVNDRTDIILQFFFFLLNGKKDWHRSTMPNILVAIAARVFKIVIKFRTFLSRPALSKGFRIPLNGRWPPRLTACSVYSATLTSRKPSRIYQHHEPLPAR